jgi:predicted Zn-dependent protease
MFSRTISLLVALLVIINGSTVWATEKDHRYAPITEQQLRQLIEETSLTSSLHGQLISRAYHSKLAKAAYQLYSEQRAKNVENPYANLYYGIAARAYWSYGLSSNVNLFHIGSDESNLLKEEIGNSLCKANELSSDSPKLNTSVIAAYGSWLFNYGKDAPEGINLLEQAAAADPQNAAIHAILGESYSHPYRGVYDLKKAEISLRMAIELDPSDSYPHYVFIRVYMDMKEFLDAQKSLDRYISLVPAEQGAPVREYFQPDITKGLKESLQK